MTDDQLRSRLRVAFWCIGIASAIIQAVVYGNYINNDTISYMDMSDAISWHNPARLINATWSPLFPVLVGIANAVFHPSPYWEFPLAHWVNVVCFLFAFASFEFFFRSFEAAWNPENLPRWALMVLGYSLFLWGSLGMVTLILPGPDMLMCGFLYLGAGLCIRIHQGHRAWHIYAALGIALACGYLAKTVMFPLGVLLIAMTFFAPGTRSTKWKGSLLAALCFVVIAGPYIWAVSGRAHHPTFGEASTIVHMTHVDRVDGYFQTPGGAKGHFIHPMVKIVAQEPRAFLFDGPVPATYSFWYDPYYWSEGVHPGFGLRTQARVFLENLLVELQMLLVLAGVAGCALFLAFSAGWQRTVAAFRSSWPLVFLLVFTLFAYATLYVESRYLGGFFAIAGVALLFGLRFASPLPARVVRTVVAVMLLNLALNAALNLRGNRFENSAVLGDSAAAVALARDGIAPGDSVAEVSPSMYNGWARLAHVRIIVDVDRKRVNQFWQEDPAYYQTAFQAFAAAGCKAVVARIGPTTQPAPGWQRLGDSIYAVHMLTTDPGDVSTRQPHKA